MHAAQTAPLRGIVAAASTLSLVLLHPTAAQAADWHEWQNTYTFTWAGFEDTIAVDWTARGREHREADATGTSVPG